MNISPAAPCPWAPSGISGATFLSWDLIDSRKFWLRPAVILLLGALSYLLAVHSPGIISTLTLSYTVFSAKMAPAVVLLFWKKRMGLNHWGAVASFITGAAGVVLLYVLRNSGHWGGSLLFVPTAASTLSLLIFSWTSSYIGSRP